MDIAIIILAAWTLAGQLLWMISMSDADKALKWRRSKLVLLTAACGPLAVVTLISGKTCGVVYRAILASISSVCDLELAVREWIED